MLNGNETHVSFISEFVRSSQLTALGNAVLPRCRMVPAPGRSMRRASASPKIPTQHLTCWSQYTHTHTPTYFRAEADQTISVANASQRQAQHFQPLCSNLRRALQSTAGPVRL